MGLFKKPNRKFRQREARNDSEDESGSTETVEIKDKSKPEKSIAETETISYPSTSGSSTISSVKEKEDKNDTNVPKATKLLSFHDEEDGKYLSNCNLYY